jgi:DtxR family Mn-dependent transcriptional regulator
MNENLFSLIIGITVIAVIFILFYPKKGIWAKWKRANRDTHRINIEDALKHFYDFEANDMICSIETISECLSISIEESGKIVKQLKSLGLIRYDEKGLKLNADGRAYALRVLRIHRLWESYLAHETSIDEAEWHDRAEEVEHDMSLDEANELAAKIGNPLIDPHGDPIPTSDGSIQHKNELSIFSLKEGDIARITHLEDEPKEIYAQLVAQGFYIDQQIRINRKTNERIVVESNGELFNLAPVVAQNISIQRQAESIPEIESSRRMSDLRIGTICKSCCYF